MKHLISNDDIASLCLELSLLLHAGVSTGDALSLLAEEGDRGGVLKAMAEQVDSGETLSAALRDSKAFPLYVCGLVEVGERTGRTEEALAALSQYYEDRVRLARRVRSALLYPAVMLALMLVVIGVLLVKVLPIFDDVYASLGGRLTGVAGGLLAIGRWLDSAMPVLWVLLALMLAGTLDVDVTSVIAVLSVAGLAVSMALQNTLSNLAGGLVLLVTKPFGPGDYVEADGVSGTVAAVNMAYTIFHTPDNKEIFVPNSQLSATKIINYNRLGRRRMDLKFTASYDAPTGRVRAAIQEVLSAVPGILDDPAPAVYLSEYQSSSIEYLVRLWAAAGDYWEVYYALLEGVRESFSRHGVEMTYDHLNVHIVEK